MSLNIIVAQGINREIGVNGDLPWHLSADLKRFKALTMGHPVIMGRKTWESLPHRPLPGRLNIVLTRQKDYIAEGAQKADSLQDALQICGIDSEPFIIGGAQIYAQALPETDTLHITQVDAPCPDADAFFPELSAEEWECEIDGEPVAPRGDTPGYKFLTLHRRR